MKVGTLIRELKKFPDDWKVVLETYEMDGDQNYVKNSLRSVGRDREAKKYVLVG